MRAMLELVPKTDQSLALPADVVAVTRNPGLFEGMRSNREIRKESGRVRTETAIAALQAGERITKSQTALAELQIKGALVANGLADLGALIEDIDQKVGVCTSRLTASAQAEWGLHIDARAEANSAIDTYVARGILTPEEASAFRGRASANLASSVNGGQRRLESNCDAVDTIRNLALSGLRRAAESIK